MAAQNEMRWEIAQYCLEDSVRDRVVGSLRGKFPRIERGTMNEMYDQLALKVARGEGEEYAFRGEVPDGALVGEKPDGALQEKVRGAMITQLSYECKKHVNRPEYSRIEHGDFNAITAGLTTDMDEVIPGSEAAEAKRFLIDALDTAGKIFSDDQLEYFVLTEIYGLSREELRQRDPKWNAMRIKRTRKEIGVMFTGMRARAAAFGPVIFLRNLFERATHRAPELSAAAQASSTSGAGRAAGPAVLLLLTVAIGGGIYGATEHDEKEKPKPAVAAAAPKPGTLAVYGKIKPAEKRVVKKKKKRKKKKSTPTYSAPQPVQQTPAPEPEPAQTKSDQSVDDGSKEYLPEFRSGP